jgi:hypothetical protein
VTAAAKNKEYGAEDPEFTYVSSELLGSDALAGSLAREPGENAGTYAITQGSLSGGGNYTIDYVGAVFTITAAALPEPAWHVSPPLSLEYDGTAKAFMALVGGAGPSQYSSTAFTYLYEGQNGTSYAATATAPTQVGNYRLTTTASGNYTARRQTDFAITPKLLTVRGLSAESKSYDGTSECVLSGAAQYEGLVDGEEFAVIGAARGEFADARAGGNKSVAVEGISAPSRNYRLQSPYILRADIHPLIVEVVADKKTKPYGTPDPILTYAHSPLVGNDALTGSLERSTGEDVGAHPITQGTLAGGDNYTINFSGADLDIVPAQQSIEPFAPIPNQTYGNGATVTITPPAASSGLPVSITVKSGPAIINGNTLTITGVGTVVLAADHLQCIED